MRIPDPQPQLVQFRNGELEIAACLTLPSGQGPWPGVVVIQEIFGVNAHIRDITRRFAQSGYVAIAPAIYQRQAPGFESGYTPEDVTQGRIYKNQTKASELLSDIQAAITYLQQLPQVKDKKVGCIGFCFGGHVAYLVATLEDIAATASFYGAGIATWCPGETTPTVYRTEDIQGILYGFFGLEDVSIPVEQIDTIEHALQQHQISHRIFRYPGAAHGFFCDQRASYNKAAATDAWQQVLTLFQTTLG